MKITVKREDLILLPEKALYWPANKMLILADVHLGKAATFRSYGIPVPEGNMSDDLSRLKSLFLYYDIKVCVIAGDLIHSKQGLSPYTINEFAAWMKELKTEIHLVLGNHDYAIKKQLPSNWNLGVHLEKLKIGPFIFKHYPDPDPEGFVWAGHLHPSIAIRYSGMRYKFPCFVLDHSVGILPAFSSFTSGFAIKPKLGQLIYGISNTKVFRIN